MLASSQLWTVLKNIINKISCQKKSLNNTVICPPMEGFSN